MRPIQQDVQVCFRYTVHFTYDLFHPANALLRDVAGDGESGAPKKILVVADRHLQGPCPELPESIVNYFHSHRDVLSLAHPPLWVEGGENTKNNPKNLSMLHHAIHDARLCRHSYVAVVGGGALIDLVGYAAATSHRGIRLIRIPTTTLAQADSAVGVKNGINAFGKKNFLGTFTPPFAVLNDFRFLTTLSPRDWRGGVAEAIKVALIKDAGFFEYLERHARALEERDMAVMQQVIHRCAELHLDHIASGGDPFEYGSSRPLDFGHWAAHKLEQITRYRLRHGEAVAIGIALDSTYSYLAGFLPEEDWRRILRALSATGFALSAPELGRSPRGKRDSLFGGLDEFREHLGGRLTIMLLRKIGQGFEVHEIDRELLANSIVLLEETARHFESAPPQEAASDREAPSAGLRQTDPLVRISA